jgi:type VII secretion effector (TIGR04197 family)
MNEARTMSNRDIHINYNSSNEQSKVVSNAAAKFEKKNLNADQKSTISAIANAKAAFDDAQSCGLKFGETLDKDAANIKSIGVTFDEYDKMLSVMLKSDKYE